MMLSGVANAEMHGWSFNNGKTLEAEFVAFSGGQVSLKSIKGKITKVPIDLFSAEDLNYIELLNPPSYDLTLGKTSSQRVYPPTYNNNELPRQIHFDFTAKVKQTSNKVYNQEVLVELFIIGAENAGDKHVLYGYEKESVVLNQGSKSYFELKSQTIPITEYVLNGQLRGDAFAGYIILVTDPRGELIASKATKSKWLDIVDNLREVPVSRTFDETTGERCFPSRPKRFY